MAHGGWAGNSAAVKDEDELEDELPQNSSGSAAPEAQKRPILSGFSAGGAEGVEALTSPLRRRSWPGLGGSDRNLRLV